MAIYYHLCPLLLATGAVIEPGNFGRIVKLIGETHPLYRREMAYETFRQAHFPNRPSRLACPFCFPTEAEGHLYREHIKGYETSVLYEVESTETHPHIADANNGIQHAQTPFFDPAIISYYWKGWCRSPDPQAAVLREALITSSVKVVRRL